MRRRAMCPFIGGASKIPEDAPTYTKVGMDHRTSVQR